MKSGDRGGVPFRGQQCLWFRVVFNVFLQWKNISLLTVTLHIWSKFSSTELLFICVSMTLNKWCGEDSWWFNRMYWGGPKEDRNENICVLLKEWMEVRDWAGRLKALNCWEMYKLVTDSFSWNQNEGHDFWMDSWEVWAWICLWVHHQNRFGFFWFWLRRQWSQKEPETLSAALPRRDLGLLWPLDRKISIIKARYISLILPTQFEVTNQTLLEFSWV